MATLDHTKGVRDNDGSGRILYPAAALSMGAAIAHLWAAPEHLAEWWGYGVFFLIVALAQGLCGLALLRRPGRPVYLTGIAGNLAIVSFYVTTRTAGIPFLGPHAGEVHAAGTFDVAVAAAEILLVLALAALAGAPARIRLYAALGGLQAFGAGLLLHVSHARMHDEFGSGFATHYLAGSALAIPLSVLAVWAATPIARQLAAYLFGEEEAHGLRGRLTFALTGAAAYAVASIPGNGLAIHHAAAGSYLAQAGRDASVTLGAALLVLFAAAALRGAPWEEPRVINVWRPRALAAVAGFAAAFAVLAGPTLAGHDFSRPATAEQATAADCSDGTADRTYDVAAVNVEIPFNRWGDLDPHGQVYVLQQDKSAMKNWDKPLNTALPADDPENRRLRPRPLVIRANAGECVKINFSNELNKEQWGGRLVDPRASMQVRGPSYNAQTSDGGRVGYNDDTSVPIDDPATEKKENQITYYWQTSKEEGLYLFNSQTMTAGEEEDAGSVAHGLYGALAVEPAGSEWLDPVSGKKLYTETNNQSGELYIDAMISPPGAKAFRESVQLAQDYNEVAPGDVGHGFNYGTEPQRNREKAERLVPDGVGEEVSLSSWGYGDPALVKLASNKATQAAPWNPGEENCGLADTQLAGGGTAPTSCYTSNVAHSYPKDPTKIRYAMAGTAETHIFHMHAHQWLANPKDTEAFEAANKLDPNAMPKSPTIDSQTFGPGETFTADLLFGAGSKPGTIGDSIFHCHLYPHFAEGFWSIFRVHDVLENGKEDLAVPGSGKTPDGTRVNNLMPLPDRTAEAPPAPTVANPGFPRFIPGEYGWRAPQAPDSIMEDSGIADDPGTVKREDLKEAERIVAGKKIDPAKLEIEQKVQNLNYKGAEPKPGAPLTDPCPSGAREVTYNVSVMQRDVVYNEAGWHDNQGRFLVLNKDVPKMLEKDPNTGKYLHQPEPLFARVGAGDCVNFNLTNLLPNWFGNDAFVKLAQTNMMGQHIHLVKFDVLGSDGSTNGWNYQQAAFTNEQAEFNRKLLDADPTNDPTCDAQSGCRIPTPPDWNAAWNGGTQPGQTISERWYADYELRTIFSHDHHFAAVDQNRGQFAGLLVEPKGMDFRNPKSGDFYQPGSGFAQGAPTCGSSCEGNAVGAAMDIIGPGAKDDFREFGLAIQDYVSNFRKEADTTAELQDRANALVPPAAPEHYPDADPGIVGVNYRNAPFPLRQEKNGQPTDPAHTFSSTVHGDPETPILEAYSDDPVQVRLIQGSQEHQHVFEMHGARWRDDPDNPDSPYVNAKTIGISEAFNFKVPKLTCGPDDQTCAGDYLYSSPNVDDLYMGMWGIMRTRGTVDRNVLLPLPDNDTLPAGTAPPAPSATAPPEATSPGTPCAPGAPVKKYDVVAMEANIKYNKHGDHDPYGLIYALAEDEAAIRSGAKKPEPLVLRANEGDCIEVRLFNKLTSKFLEHKGAPDGDAMPPLEPATGTRAGLRVSLHPQLVKYDVRGSDGTAVGHNRDQTVGPGESKLYRWFADDVTPGEIGTTNLTDFGDVRGHRHHGLFAGLNIEPKGATYHDPTTGAEIKSGVSADIRVPGENNDFREFTAFFQDGLNLRDSNNAWIADPPPPAPGHGEEPEPPEFEGPAGQAHDNIDQGEKGFNYGNAPFRHRLNGVEPVTATEINPLNGQALSNVYSSEVHGDPDTPVFRAFAGDDVRMRVLQGADKQRQNAFQLAGHSWWSHPDDPSSVQLSTLGGFSVGRAANIHLNSAGGPGAFPGDYRYNDAMYRHHLSGGMWGIMRVYPQPLGDGLNPNPIMAADNPRAEGNHPILPLEIPASQSAVTLEAAPASLQDGQATVLSGKLTRNGSPLAGKRIVLEQKPAGASAFAPVPNADNLSTDADGNFRLEGVKPDENTTYRASFAGDPRVNIGASEATKQVSVVVPMQVSGLSASKPELVHGETTAISGKLTRGGTPDGAPVAGRQVFLEQKAAGAGEWSRVPDQAATTNDSGGFDFQAVKPVKHTDYRVAFDGDNARGFQAVKSAPISVKVKVAITTNLSATTVKPGKKLAIYGAVSPNHTGSVKLTIKRNGVIVPGWNGKAVPLNGSSSYSVPFATKRTGSYTVSASFDADLDHLGNTGPAKGFKVKR